MHSSSSHAQRSSRHGEHQRSGRSCHGLNSRPQRSQTQTSSPGCSAAAILRSRSSVSRGSASGRWWSTRRANRSVLRRRRIRSSWHINRSAAQRLQVFSKSSSHMRGGLLSGGSGDLRDPRGGAAPFFTSSERPGRPSSRGRDSTSVRSAVLLVVFVVLLVLVFFWKEAKHGAVPRLLGLVLERLLHLLVEVVRHLWLVALLGVVRLHRLLDLLVQRPHLQAVPERV